MKFRMLAVMALAMGSVGCYHATIDTGLPSSGTVIEEEWAHSFVYGLVPPETIETASECPNGVAMVETEHSFLNGLVAGLTWGIYTPMHITVTCAAAGGEEAADAPDGAEVIDAPDADPEALSAAFQDAVSRSLATGAPVYVRTGSHAD